MKKYLYISLALTFFLLVSAEKSFACSCHVTDEPLKKQVQNAFSSAEAVFSGTVVEIKPSLTDERSLVVKFKVSKSWKGKMQREFTLTTSKNSAMCGYNFETGKSYLVYADREKDEFSTSNCSRTAVYTSDGDIKYFIKPKLSKKKTR